MKTTIVTFVLLLATIVAFAAPPRQPPPKMRPYSGIGILMLTVATGADDEKQEPYQLYEEPAIARIGELDLARISKYEWIFGVDHASLPLVVMARKGSWLRVVYDDAGREGWLNPRQRGSFQTWDAFFKGRAGKLLPGLQKRYYQLFRHPGKGALVTLTAKSGFKVVKLENDWALVMPDQNSLGWLRWRDEDGRLLIGLDRPSP